jgi:hypothetical protein
MNYSNIKLFRIQSIEIVQCQILKKILQNILSAAFFNKIINPRNFSSQHFGDEGKVANLLQGTQVLSF